eukprot:scaffold225695_cov22-Tisochrysis_lutea.AAC.1
MHNNLFSVTILRNQSAEYAFNCGISITHPSGTSPVDSTLKKSLKRARPAPSPVQPADQIRAKRKMPSTIWARLTSSNAAPVYVFVRVR